MSVNRKNRSPAVLRGILTRMAMGNWHDEIFAYFDHPIINAYTESLNNLIRVVNRVGRGYSFEALRAKILFTEGLQQIKKPRYQRQRTPEGAMGRMPQYGVAEVKPSTNYGAEISTLAREIEAGFYSSVSTAKSGYPSFYCSLHVTSNGAEKHSDLIATLDKGNDFLV